MQLPLSFSKLYHLVRWMLTWKLQLKLFVRRKRKLRTKKNSGGRWEHFWRKRKSLWPKYKAKLSLESGDGFNPLNAELNPICHLLVLLGDLTFMVPCIVSIFQYISNKMQCYTVYLYLETDVHVSGGTSTHHQERTPPTAHSNRFQLFHESGR